MNRANCYLFLAVLINVVNDGWSGRPDPYVHQLLLIPVEVACIGALVCLLRGSDGKVVGHIPTGTVGACLLVCVVFECISLLSFWYESRHFAQFGYRLSPVSGLIVSGTAILVVAGIMRFRSGAWVLAGAAVCYGAGIILAIRNFPLNYLRSDMLPVVLWADQRLVRHLNPYTTMHVGTRLYDFPYLPGVLLAYLLPVAIGIDPRWLNLCCVLTSVGLMYGAVISRRKLAAAALIAVFLLSPFLQYRHDLYLAPHWLLLVVAVLLLQARWFGCGAAVFGASMAVYQLSWVLWPFLLLFALRRRGWLEVIRTAGLSLLTMTVLIGPFLHSALQRIASNTVGQWSRLPHALAEPMNLSYWVTYLVRPDQLKWVQLCILSALFLWCLGRGRCKTLEDTLRWMSAALAIFIALNVLVDGYFYLTLLLLLLMYTLSAEGFWARRDAAEHLNEVVAAGG